MMSDRPFTPFSHSSVATMKFPAPVREMYFTAQDYALACMRVHERRLAFDGTKNIKARA